MDEHTQIGYSVARAFWYQRILLNQFFSEYSVPVTHEQWMVLKTVAAHPGVSQTEVSRETLKDKTNITRILDLLERKGYIQRRSNAEDRRKHALYITDKGSAVLESVPPVIAECERKIVSGLKPEERKTLVSLLDKVVSGIKKSQFPGS